MKSIVDLAEARHAVMQMVSYDDSHAMSLKGRMEVQDAGPPYHAIVSLMISSIVPS